MSLFPDAPRPRRRVRPWQYVLATIAAVATGIVIVYAIGFLWYLAGWQ